ncbi:MAG: Trk family potassium uptake protein [Candidatus Coatesbacteria bacterium]|nr:Trk family potassium uptake protein [Candidatus Coatesbacteria bacterium]
MSYKGERRSRTFLPSQILVGSFAGAIVLGSILLYLPFSATDGHTDFIDCLFTATSATCVTGLVVTGTGSHFTTSGQAIILALIQFGGIGIMTAGIFLTLLFGRSLSMKEQAIIKDTLNPLRPRRVGFVVVYTVLFTIVIESFGVALLHSPFVRYGAQRPLWTAVFHSVSAFCNAGFSTFDTNLEQLGLFPSISMVIMVLLILGGLGFFVILDAISGLKRRFTGATPKKAPLMTLHTRLALIVTVWLLLVGMLGLYALEQDHACKEMDALTGLRESLFLSASARTAGFSTFPVSNLSNASQFFLSLLMFIGACPGSTGGGIKTVTFALVVFFAAARIRGKSEVNVMNRRIPESVISKSLAITSLSILVVSLSILALLVLEKDTPASPSFMQVLFEATSAFGTVGLSTGITASLTTGGKLVIIALMFLGRLGPLTVATLVATKARTSTYSYPEEDVMVG